MSSQEDLTHLDDRRTSPVNIPGEPYYRNGRVAHSAPTARRQVAVRSSLVDTVLDESDVIICSSYLASSLQPRREAELREVSSSVAKVYGAADGAGGDGYAGESIQVPHELETSVEVAEDYVKIASRNKRAEHATTYVKPFLSSMIF